VPKVPSEDAVPKVPSEDAVPKVPSGGATKIKGFLSKHGKMLGTIGGIIAAAAIIGATTSAIEKNGEKIFTAEEKLSEL
jgi:hypothetical protein